MGESKPTQMYVTTTREAFQDPRESYLKWGRSLSTKHGKTKRIVCEAECPFPKHSMYKQDFMNWGKGVKLIEKRPDFPKYRLKFTGKSSYKEQCEKSDEMWREIKEKRNFLINMDT